MVRIVFLILVFLTTANSKPRASFEHVDNLIKKYGKLVIYKPFCLFLKGSQVK